MPHAWGTNDCATFVADGVASCSDTLLLDGVDRNWTSAEEAAAAIQERGGLIAYLDARLSRVEPLEAQRGDVCLVKDEDGQPSLAICAGGGFCAAPGEVEMVLTSMSEARLVWRT